MCSEVINATNNVSRNMTNTILTNGTNAMLTNSDGRIVRYKTDYYYYHIVIDIDHITI